MRLLRSIWLLLACTIVQYEAVAQACTGYVLYKEDFGGDNSSPSMGGPLPAGETSYHYTTDIPVEDGQYGIRKEVEGHPESWLRGSDHTGNGGYMMVVNASYDAGLFFQSKIDGLCPGSSFYFSTWVANLESKQAHGPLDPNLKFVILRASDSSEIAEYQTGTLARYNTLTWEEYGIHFTLPAGESSLILQMFNNQPGGDGNDLVLDDIEFSLCGPAVDIQQVGTYQQTHDVCAGSPISFKATVESGFYHQPQYQWQFSRDNIHWTDIAGAVTTDYDIHSSQFPDSGWYRFLAAEKGNLGSPYCRIASQSIPLNVFSPQSSYIISNSPVCEGDSLFLYVPDALEYQWTGPGGFSSKEQHLVFDPVNAAQEGMYAITRLTRGGCIDHAEQSVTVQSNDLVVSLEGDSLLCEGRPIFLDASNDGATYLWNTGATTPGIPVQSEGFYQVTVSKGACRRSDAVIVRSIKIPVADLGNDTTVCLGESFMLDATFPDVERYRWQDGSDSAVHAVTQSGTYSVTISNYCGTAQDAVNVQVENCADHLLFPTAFSPNHDGQNDFFRPRVFIEVEDYRIEIFDRWGRAVFQSRDPLSGWDGTYKGKNVPMGAYVWTVRYTRHRDGHPLTESGSITLIR